MSPIKKILDIVPSALASRAFGVVSDVSFPAPIQRAMNRSFVRLARIQADEAALPIESYANLNRLFTRELKTGARPISAADAVSPVDGRLSEKGVVADGMLLDVKGRSYSAQELVGADLCRAAGVDMEWIREAFAMTIYLSPRDYHHIHAPVSGCVSSMTYVPGRLLPVNRLGYALADDLLPTNERLTSFLETEAGYRVAVVKVGATCVGRISVEYDAFKTNHGANRAPFFRKLSEPYAVHAGDKLGCFELGSTVVLLFENGKKRFVPNPELQSGQKIVLGSALGNWVES